ncbi:cell separation during budding [Fusarium irregulare]|uniref:Protein SDS23 n=1 Tax=Fusarium irregulare TaxID=2494466 RepID=A0A9W8Q0Y6_9HYPO|nr:cell separation during budding [Fusarium irregulare]KAJ4023870.1 cell separation during budding [Fusarium irregulare]
MDPSPSSSRELKDTRATSSTSLNSAASGSSSTNKPPTLSQRSPSVSISAGSGPSSISAHRSSFAENLRNAPSSPRSQRHPSFTQAALQELLSHPPAGNKHANPKFAGRDWRDVAIGELVSPDDIKWVEFDTSVEEATKTLLKSPTNVVLIRENASTHTAVSTFDYTDLNVYLLVVVGLVKPEEDQITLFNTIMGKAQEGGQIPLRDVFPLFHKESLITLPGEEKLSQAIQILGSGIHRLLVTAISGEVVGIASQLRIVEFFWNEGVNFPSIDRLYPALLRDLGVGTKDIVSVNSDAALSEALTLMHDEGLTSVAVVDNGLNVVGNISTKDVRHLTKSSNAHLLNSSCMNFISVILNERGVEHGRDAFPVFYVNPYSTLAHTVAKLVATRSHRMWVVESASPSPSAPATPLMGPQSFTTPAHPPPAMSASTSTHAAPPSPVPTAAVPASPVPTAAVPASAMAGARLSGRLTGVISLTDVLNMFAKSTGLNPSDPNEERARRRRSSSSSVRPSMDSHRPSIDFRR